MIVHVGDTAPATLEAKNVAERQEKHESATLGALNVAERQENHESATLMGQSVAKLVADAPERRVHPRTRAGGRVRRRQVPHQRDAGNGGRGRSKGTGVPANLLICGEGMLSEVLSGATAATTELRT